MPNTPPAFARPRYIARTHSPKLRRILDAPFIFSNRIFGILFAHIYLIAGVCRNRFIGSENQNLKYLGVTGLSEIVQVAQAQLLWNMSTSCDAHQTFA